MHALLLATLVALGQAHFTSEGGATHANIQGSTTRHGGHPLNDGGRGRDGYRQYQVPIVKDCAGDMRGEAARCICRKQYGFRKSVCAAGQQCFRGDGTCHDFQTVTCSYSGNASTMYLAAFYTGNYAAYENDDAGRDDSEPGTLVRFDNPVAVMGRAAPRRRDSFSFEFTDMGPDFDLLFTYKGSTCSSGPDNIIDEIVCETPSGPWTAGLTLSTQNSNAENTDSSEGGEMGIFLLLEHNRDRGQWTGKAKVACQDAEWTAVSYSPYRENNAVTCHVVDEVGLGEVGCGAMRDAGVDCCYDNNREQCGFNRRCKFDGGLFLLPNNDWEVEVFGNPERNHLHDLADRLIAGRAKVPTGSRVVAMTHSHGDDAIDHAHPASDDGKVDGEDDPIDDAHPHRRV